MPTSSDQETRWCPGCGDYAILASVQGFMPELGIPPEKIVFVTGIGCAGRFVYYMDTYGMHGIHGRAPALATGVATSRPDLSVWVVSGDGDALSIGGNHLIHALRRNVPLKILLFNNQIYGLTKGQYSPTSEEGKVTKSTPFGSQDHPFNPVSLALGAEASFVARTVDTDKHVAETRGGRAPGHGVRRDLPELQRLQRRRLRRGARGEKERNQIRPSMASRSGSGSRRSAESCAVPTGAWSWSTSRASARTPCSCTTPTAEPSLAFELAHLAARPTGPRRSGSSAPWSARSTEPSCRRRWKRRAQVGTPELEALLHSGDTWTVSEVQPGNQLGHARAGVALRGAASSAPSACGRARCRSPSSR